MSARRDGEVVSQMDKQYTEIDVLGEVEAERRRQTAKGYTPEHDDGHHFGDLIDFAEQRLMNFVDDGWDKPDRHMLVEAAALIVASIERLDRGSRRPKTNPA